MYMSTPDPNIELPYFRVMLRENFCLAVKRPLVLVCHFPDRLDIIMNKVVNIDKLVGNFSSATKTEGLVLHIRI
jgi:hypothetical protein